jgi:hypothetical protein
MGAVLQRHMGTVAGKRRSIGSQGAVRISGSWRAWLLSWGLGCPQKFPLLWVGLSVWDLLPMGADGL